MSGEEAAVPLFDLHVSGLSEKKRRLCPALNGGAIIFRSASFAHFIVARRRDEVDDGARAPLLAPYHRKTLLFPFAHRTTIYAQIVREETIRGDARR